MEKKTITVPLDEIQANHLEFEVKEERDGTFTVVEHTAGNAAKLEYTGFPSRHEAEKFVLAQPYPWED